jgi:hypothetical protein
MTLRKMRRLVVRSLAVSYMMSSHKGRLDVEAYAEKPELRDREQSRTNCMHASRWIIGLLALLSGCVNAHASDCLTSAAAVRQRYPQAWPSWTLRAQGHEGTTCWYGATPATAHNHQDRRTGVEQGIRQTRVPEVSPPDVPRPRPDPSASFAERFSAAYWRNFKPDLGKTPTTTNTHYGRQ